MKFEILKNDNKSNARTGKLHTAHGVIETPIFMPVGTRGSVKAVHQRELSEDIKESWWAENKARILDLIGVDDADHR